MSVSETFIPGNSDLSFDLLQWHPPPLNLTRGTGLEGTELEGKQEDNECKAIYTKRETKRNFVLSAEWVRRDDLRLDAR